MITRNGCTGYLSINGGLYQSSRLSPVAFTLIVDAMKSELGSKHLESMLLADDLVFCVTSREEMEQELERWRDPFYTHGLRISRPQTEHVPLAHQ